MRPVIALLFISLLSSLCTTKAQETNKSTYLRIGALWPRISIERQIGRNSSLQAGLGIAHHNETRTENRIESGSSILYHKPRGRIFSRNNYGTYDEYVPFLALQYRYYYNLRKGSKSSEKVKYLSANYFALRDYIYLDGLNTIGIVYGIQLHRNRFWFDINGGIGNSTKGKESSGRLLGDLTIGFLLIKSP